MKRITCAPLLSGNIMIVKERPDDTPEVLNRNLKTQDIGEYDAIGQTLVAELGSRKYYALIIGIDEYDHSEIIDLDHPVNDSKLLAEVLTEYYSFEVSDLTLLHNPTRAEIIEALDMLADQVSEKDNLLVFYAGHGIWNAQLNQGYWLPSDAAPDVKSNWLSNSTIRDYIGGIRTKHTLLIADACFSGGILKERALFANSKAILEMYKLPSRKALISGTLNTVYYNNVFMQYLLKNLKENTEPLLSADQLFRNFKTAVINNSPNGQVPQYGPISQAGDEGGDFILLRRDY